MTDDKAEKGTAVLRVVGGELFAEDAEGRPTCPIATLFLRTPGLVTVPGVHATQRLRWLAELNGERTAAGLPALSAAEEEAELAASVELVVRDGTVAIRPDPARTDLALRADELLQTLVSKRRVRFLNVRSLEIRGVLRARGENWRMAAEPLSRAGMRNLVANARLAVPGEPACYHAAATGTRFLTAGGCEGLDALPTDEARRLFAVLRRLLGERNRLGFPALELFPRTTPPEIRRAILDLDPAADSDVVFRSAVRRLYAAWRMTVPENLREESDRNDAWVNEMCRALTAGPADTGVDEEELAEGLAPEFDRQIRWLPGVRVTDGIVRFDSLWDEYDRTRAPELADLCDERARNILLNVLRVFADLEYVNVGRRLGTSAAEGEIRRGSEYLFQCKRKGRPAPEVYVLRFQERGVAEALDEGKGLAAAVREAVETTDGILDRRLMCLQLGMRLPDRIGHGRYGFPYAGPDDMCRGLAVTRTYFIRAYIPGTASNRIPPARLRNPAFALRLADLLGTAAAVDLACGRVSSVSRAAVFDTGDEIVTFGPDALPASVAVADHADTFADVDTPLETLARGYAGVVTRRAAALGDFRPFASRFMLALEAGLCGLRERYRANREAFDGLFAHRSSPGPEAALWRRALYRLDACDETEAMRSLAKAIGDGLEA